MLKWIKKVFTKEFLKPFAISLVISLVIFFSLPVDLAELIGVI